MLNKIILLSFVAISLTACGGNNANVNSTLNTNNTNVANTPVNANVNSNSTNTNSTTTNTNVNKPADTNVNKPANTTAAKPAETSPKRIAFAAGKSEGKENITLAAGASKQFVVGAKTGQILMIDAASKDTKISLIKGKVATNATLEEPGHYDTTLLDNGDFVFEVKNISKGELKTTIEVVISGGH